MESDDQMTSEPVLKDWAAVREPPRRSIIGPTVFALTLCASLVFFWWLLIYDHGLPAAH